MRHRARLILAAGALAVIGCQDATQGDLSRVGEAEVSDSAIEAEVLDPAIEISVTTDRLVYAPDEPIAIRLDVTNRTNTVVVFRFWSSQRYDFLIQDEGGGTRWHWSADIFFLAVLGEERLAPNDTLTYRERFEGQLPPGTYTVEGTLVARNPLLANAAIIVR